VQKDYKMVEEKAMRMVHLKETQKVASKERKRWIWMVEKMDLMIGSLKETQMASK